MKPMPGAGPVQQRANLAKGCEYGFLLRSLFTATLQERPQRRKPVQAANHVPYSLELTGTALEPNLAPRARNQDAVSLIGRVADKLKHTSRSTSIPRENPGSAASAELS